MARVTAENLLSASARVMTDDLKPTTGVGKHFVSHETVSHTKKEYVRGDATTNTVKGFIGLLKRGVDNVNHHVGKKHVHRYTSEFGVPHNSRA